MLRTICFIKKDNSAFTMIELLVVIAVLGILASIAVPRMSGVTERARLAVDQAAVRNLNSVTSVYRSSKHSDPFIDQANTNQSLLQILADNDYIPDNFEPQSENLTFDWSFEDKKWYLFSMFNDGVILTLDDLAEGQIRTGGSPYSGYLGFQLSSDKEHTRYTGAAKDIVIPKALGEQEVRGVYQRFFKDKGIESVSFPENSSIETIDLRSFRNNDITSISLPSSINQIGWEAFAKNDITEITIGENVNIGGGDALGTYTESFREEYENNGPGTYIWDGDNWIKE